MVPCISRNCRPLLALVLILAGAFPASAQRDIREWRSLGEAEAVAVNAQNGSVWAAIGSFVYHLSADGTALSRVRFVPDLGRAGRPASVAVNPADGSCWAFGGDAEEPGVLVHYAADGSEMWRQTGLGDPGVSACGYISSSLAVYPLDGSCWVAAISGVSGHLWHVSASGQVLFSSASTIGAGAGPVAVNPADGSCWVASGSLLHLAADGTELWRGPLTSGVVAIGMNPVDGSVWVADWPDIMHLDAGGNELSRRQPWPDLAVYINGITVNPLDGSAWLACTLGVAHLAPDGSVLWDGDEGPPARDVSVDPRNGSVWATKHGGADRVVHFAADGTTLWRMAADYFPGFVAANPADGSCWVTDPSGLWLPAALAGGLAHVSADGTTLWHSAPPTSTADARAVAVYPQDGSVWLAEDEWQTTAPYTATSRIRRLGAAGTELWRRDVAVSTTANPPIMLASLDTSDASLWVSVSDPRAIFSYLRRYDADGTLAWSTSFPGGVMPLSAAGDGSCWVVDGTAHAANRLDRDGVVRGWAPLTSPGAIAADSADGSCWVMDLVNRDSDSVGSGCQLVRIAADGSERWRSPILDASRSQLAVDSTTGFCWVTDERGLFIYSSAGVELWRGQVPAAALAVGSPDGSCWLATDELTHLQIPLTPFGDISYWHWARDEINACAEAGIVQGYPNGAHLVYHPDQGVTRDQMAAYLARAVAGGDDAVPEPAGAPTFSDVDADHWAYRYVEYGAQQDLVEGYASGGYQPDSAVTRDQMAAYIARALAGGDALVPTGPAEASFTDVATDYWAYDYIAYCASEGVVQGYPDGGYHPEEGLTRDQMAIFISRAYRLPLGWTTEW
jgi:DNA-binding beta-propeller fold protein YncE